MKQKPSSRRKHISNKTVLRLPDLEHAKTAVLNSLKSTDANPGYRHAIEEFVDWYCSEPRLAFNISTSLKALLIPQGQYVGQSRDVAAHTVDHNSAYVSGYSV